MNTTILGIVIAAIIVMAVVILAVALVRRRRGGIDLQPLPGNLVQAYQSRLPELERLFVSQPREAVAAAKLLVDDMLNRIGYPVRMTNDERVRDLKRHHRGLADRYGKAANLKSDPTTEQLRQSLQAYLAIGNDLLGEAGDQSRRRESQQRRELA